jgi:poly(A) polymerase
MTPLLTAGWMTAAPTQRLITALGADNVRFVGGAVRDTLLGLTVSDVDIATPLLPATVMEKLKEAGIKTIPTGIEHGTVTAIADATPFEVTTLRRDVETDGRRAVVTFATDWQEDAARRDFTINALYVNVSGQVYDYYGGLDDLTERRVRFIGDAETRIKEDALRILRFFRFQARYGQDQPDESGYSACVARRNDLMALSRERVRDELLKLLATANPAPVVDWMLKGRILEGVLPEIATSDRLARLIDVERQFGDAASLRRLASLLPDDGNIIADVARRLKLSLAQQRRLIAMAVPLVRLDDKSLRVEIYRRGGQAVIDALLLAAESAHMPELQLQLAKEWQAPKLPISGQMLIDRGVPVGPEVSARMKRFEQLWVEADFTSNSGVLIKLVEIAVG